MLNTGRNPGSSQVIEDALADETTEDAELLRPMLVQLRAAADRPVPAPSAALQLLLDGGPVCSGVTQLMRSGRAGSEGRGPVWGEAGRRYALAVVMPWVGTAALRWMVVFVSRSWRVSRRSARYSRRLCRRCLRRPRQ
jgi:hypothetical protein